MDIIYCSIDAVGQQRKLVIISLLVNEDRTNWIKQLTELNVEIPSEPFEEIDWLLAHPDALVPWEDSLLKIDKDGLPTRPCAFRFTVHYANLTMEKILKSLLPSEMEAITSFSVVGHIAHFNLKEHALPFRKLIGKSIAYGFKSISLNLY